MTTHNHYGIHLSTDEPTTGVYTGNDLAWEFLDDFIDPGYERAVRERAEELVQEGMAKAEEEMGNEFDPDYDYVTIDDVIDQAEYDCESYSSDTQLYGDWRKVGGLYEPDPNGEFALIYDSNDNYVQVVHSTTIKYGRMCSPCFPGQVDARLDDPDHPTDIHIQAYYALPDWATYERD